MQRFDATTAAFAGFGIIRRTPFAPAVWGVILLLGALPSLLIFPVLFSALPELAKTGSEPDVGQIMAMQMKFMALQPLSIVGSLASRTLVVAAIFRAVLQPLSSRYFFLRAGMGELMLLVVTFVLGMVAAAVMMFALVFIGLLILAVYQASHVAAILAGVIAGLALIGLAVWLILRLSLAVPMSFAQKEFRLIEGWRLTRGNVGSLLVMAIVNYVVVMVLQLVIGVVLIAVLVAAVFASGFNPAAFNEEAPDMAQIMAALGPFIPWLVAILAVGGVLAGYLITVATAPWAAAYQALLPAEEPPVAQAPPAVEPVPVAPMA